MNPFSQHGQLRWLVWLGIGAVIHLCFVLASWVLFRTVDLSSLMPWVYSDYGWVMMIIYYCLWVWLWINE